MPPGISVPLTFAIYKDGQLLRTETLTQDVIKIGKLSQSHLRLDDEGVSRMHAVIEVTGPSEVNLIDLGSTKGTLVNGKKVSKARLQSGDEIVLGDTRIVVTVGTPVTGVKPAGAQPAPPAARITTMGIATVNPSSLSVDGAGAAGPRREGPAMTPTGAPRVSPATTPTGTPRVAPAAPGSPIPRRETAVRPAVGATRPAGGLPASLARREPAAGAPRGSVPPGTARPGAPQQVRSAASMAPAATAAAGMVAAAAPGGAPAPGPVLAVADPNAVEVRDGSRAIEVMAMFEDAIIETRYLTKFSLKNELKLVRPTTLYYLFGGLGALAAAFIMFLVAYVQVSQLRVQREAWEHAHPGGEAFPIKREGSAGDFVALALFLGGLGATVYGLYRFSVERPSRDNIKDFTIGPDPKAIVNLPGEMVPRPLFPLVRAAGPHYELLFTSQMKGDVTVGGETLAFSDLLTTERAIKSAAVNGAHAYVIPNGARAKVDFGETTFLVNSVPPPRRYPKPFKPDWNALMYLGGTTLVLGLFLAMIFSLPPDSKSLSIDSIINDQRIAKFIVKPPEEKEEQIPDYLKKKAAEEAGGKGKRHKGEEGKMGKPTSRNKTGLFALKGPRNNTDVHLARAAAEQAAATAGVLGVLKQAQGGALSSIFGRESALGSDAETVLGGLVGTQTGEAFGAGGLGLVGTGRGGGGTGEGTIGLGTLGTIGRGGGGGGGAGYGRGAGNLGGRRAAVPDVVPGTAQVRGALDKEIIRRVIRRHLNEVKFCYERELAKKPDLYGRVAVQFTISATGAVVAAVVQQSTISNSSVEDCVTGAVRRWEFPKPQGGGVVIVSYPFVFKSSGAAEE